MDTTKFIVHICSRRSWQRFLEQGSYSPLSLQAEGFIHCSRPEQVLQVANHYYPAEQDLLLLWLDPRQLSSDLRWDLVGDTTFPHVYGPINLEAVQAVSEFSPDQDGIFRTLEPPG